MKKILALALAMMMVLTLAACGEKTPTPSGNSGQEQTNTPDPGASQQTQTPSGSDLYDITDDQINAADETYYSTFKYLQGDERAAMLAEIPSEARKVIGTVSAGLSSIQPSPAEDAKYLFSSMLSVKSPADYTTLADYYKSLGGTVTEDDLDDIADLYTLKVDYSWGRVELTCKNYSESGEHTVSITFDIF